MKRYKNIALGAVLATILTLLYSLDVSAQQYIGHTQSMWNQMAINPAYAGSEKSLDAGLFVRNQWMNLEGAPRTENLFVHSPIAHGDFGVGLNVMRDRLGISSTVGAQASFAYRLRFDQGTLAFGLSGEFANHRMNWTETDAFQEGDQAIPFGDIAQAEYNFGFGTFFRNEHFYVGLSVPRLLESETLFTDPEAGLEATYGHKRHFYLNAGGIWRAGESLYIQPVMMARYVEGAPFQTDLGVLFYVNNMLWVGPSFRWGDSFSIMIDYEITEQLRVGYAYDFTISQIQGHLGSHEFFLGYTLGQKSDGYNHPRFF